MKSPEESEDEERTEDAELFTDDREDEIGVRVGQVAPLRLPAPDAHAEEVSRAEADQ